MRELAEVWQQRYAQVSHWLTVYGSSRFHSLIVYHAREECIEIGQMGFAQDPQAHRPNQVSGLETIGQRLHRQARQANRANIVKALTPL